LYEERDGNIVPLKKILNNWRNSILDQRKHFPDIYEKDLRNIEAGYVLYADYCGEPPALPNPDDYMPTGEWYQLFQTVSEGTPLSPPFETPEELVDWLSNNKDFWGATWSREAAIDMVGAGYTPSMVMSGGKIYMPEDQHLLKKKGI
jgi:hypothetical protein